MIPQRTMLLHLSLVGLLLHSAFSYNTMCNRNCPCKNNGRYDQATKKCQCQTGYLGFDCGLNMQSGINVLCPTSSNVCQGDPNSDTICYNSDNCYCDGFSFGRTCKYKLDSVTCTQTSMTVSMAFRKDDIKMSRAQKHFEGGLKCELADTKKEQDGFIVYEKTLDFLKPEAECGNVIQTETFGDTITNMATVRVRYFRGFHHENDFTVDFMCNISAIGHAKTKDSTEEMNPINFLITNTSGFPVSKIREGEPYNLLFLLKDTSKYKSLTVKDLSVYDDTTNKLIMTFVEEGHATAAANIADILRDPKERHFSYTPPTPPAPAGQQSHPSPTYTAVQIEVKPPTAHFPKNIYIKYEVRPCKVQGCGKKPIKQTSTQIHNQPPQGHVQSGQVQTPQRHGQPGQGNPSQGRGQPGQGQPNQGFQQSGQGQPPLGHGQAGQGQPPQGYQQPGQVQPPQGQGQQSQVQPSQGQGQPGQVQPIQGYQQPGHGQPPQGNMQTGRGQPGPGQHQVYQQPGQGQPPQGQGQQGQVQPLQGQGQPGQVQHPQSYQQPGQGQPPQGHQQPAHGQPTQGQQQPGHGQPPRAFNRNNLPNAPNPNTQSGPPSSGFGQTSQFNQNPNTFGNSQQTFGGGQQPNQAAQHQQANPPQGNQPVFNAQNTQQNQRGSWV